MSLLIIREEILENEDRAPIRLGVANKAFCLTAKKRFEDAHRKG